LALSKNATPINQGSRRVILNDTQKYFLVDLPPDVNRKIQNTGNKDFGSRNPLWFHRACQQDGPRGRGAGIVSAQVLHLTHWNQREYARFESGRRLHAPRPLRWRAATALIRAGLARAVLGVHAHALRKRRLKGLFARCVLWSSFASVPERRSAGHRQIHEYAQRERQVTRHRRGALSAHLEPPGVGSTVCFVTSVGGLTFMNNPG